MNVHDRFGLVATLALHAGPEATASWWPRGDELGPGGSRPPSVPPSLALEAIVHCGALLLARTQGREGLRWMLAAVDHCAFGLGRWDQEVPIRVAAGRLSTRGARIEGEAGDLCRARVLLVPFVPGRGSPPPGERQRARR